MHAIEGLILDHGVPLRLHEEDMVCSRQIQSYIVSSEGYLRIPGHVTYPVEPQRSEMRIAANAEHLNARFASPATDASRLRSPFRDQSQFTQHDIPHGSATPPLYWQGSEEQPRAYDADTE